MDVLTDPTHFVDQDEGERNDAGSGHGRPFTDSVVKGSGWGRWKVLILASDGDVLRGCAWLRKG